MENENIEFNFEKKINIKIIKWDGTLETGVKICDMFNEGYGMGGICHITPNNGNFSLYFNFVYVPNYWHNDGEINYHMYSNYSVCYVPPIKNVVKSYAVSFNGKCSIWDEKLIRKYFKKEIKNGIVKIN